MAEISGNIGTKIAIIDRCTSDDVPPGEVVDEPYIRKSVEWLPESDIEEIFGKYRSFPMEISQYPKSIQYTKKSVLIVLELFAHYLEEDADKRPTFNVNRFEVINACTIAAYEKDSGEALSFFEICNVMAFLSRFHVCIKAQLVQLKRFYEKYSAVKGHRGKDKESKFFRDVAMKYLRPIGLCMSADWIATRLEHAVAIADKFEQSFFDLFFQRISEFNISVYPAGDWLKYYDNGGLIPNHVVALLQVENNVVTDNYFDMWRTIEDAVLGKPIIDENFALERGIWERTFNSRLFNPMVYYVSSEVEAKLQGVDKNWRPAFCLDNSINVYTGESICKYLSASQVPVSHLNTYFIFCLDDYDVDGNLEEAVNPVNYVIGEIPTWNWYSPEQ